MGCLAVAKMLSLEIIRKPAQITTVFRDPLSRVAVSHVTHLHPPTEASPPSALTRAAAS